MTDHTIPTVSFLRRARPAVSVAALTLGAALFTVSACSSDASDGAPATAEQSNASTDAPPSPTDPADGTAAPPATASPSAPAPRETTVVATGIVMATSTQVDVPVTFDVPDGWDTEVEQAVLNGEPAFGVIFWGAFDQIYTDSCPSTMIDPPPGPTVDDFASPWADLPAFNASAPTDISVDGYAGKLVEFTVPDYDEGDCPYGDFMLMGTADGDGYWAQAPSGYHQVRILDVDGTRLIITAIWYPDTPAEDRAAIDEIIDSIQIG